MIITSASVYGAQADNAGTPGGGGPTAGGCRRLRARSAAGRRGADRAQPRSAPGADGHRAAAGNAGRGRRAEPGQSPLRGTSAARGPRIARRVGSSCTSTTWPPRVELAVSGRVTGDVTLGCEGSLSQEEVEALSGRRRVELPVALAMGTAERLHRLGRDVRAGQRAGVRVPALGGALDRAAGRRVGARPGTTRRASSCCSRRCPAATGLQRIGGRLGARVGGKEAALGATSATVAVLGTAAVVRQIRRHRRSLLEAGPLRRTLRR